MDTLQAIVSNYLICVITGVVFINDKTIISAIEPGAPWVIIGLVLGGVFIGTFYLMAITTQRFSMTVSSIAAKMSLVIPVLFSLFILEIQSKSYTWLNFVGMAFAVPAIFMSSYKKRKIETHALTRLDLVLPFLIFFFGGLIDSSINYTNYHFLTQSEASVFPLVIFVSAAVIGSILLIFKGQRISLKSCAGGLILGIVNYFSIYFLLRSLTVFENDGALVYPLVNVGIIIFSSGLSVLFFRERLSRLNRAGLMLSILAILFISYQEISKLL